MRARRLVALIPFACCLFALLALMDPKMVQYGQEEQLTHSVIAPKVFRKKLSKTVFDRNLLRRSKTYQANADKAYQSTDNREPWKEAAYQESYWKSALKQQLTIEDEPINGEPSTSANEEPTTTAYHDSSNSLGNFWNQGNPTIVTSLIDIGRGQWYMYRRPYAMYQDYMKPLLALDVHLFVFADEKGSQFIREHRKLYLNKTAIQIISLKDLPYYKDMETMRRIVDKEQRSWNRLWDSAMKNHPEAFSVEYLLLMNSKAHFMNEAASRNPFGSTHFFWLDAGYGHGHASYPPPGSSWAPQRLLINMDDHVTFIKLGQVDLSRVELDSLYRKDVALIVGSFFGGTSQAVAEYYRTYDETYSHLLSRNMVDDDQTLIVLCYKSKPTLFEFVEGDWYDVFRLFPAA